MMLFTENVLLNPPLGVVPEVFPCLDDEIKGDGQNSCMLFGDLLLEMLAFPQEQQDEPDRVVEFSETKGGAKLPIHSLLPANTPSPEETILKEMILPLDRETASVPDLSASLDKVTWVDQLHDNIIDNLLLKVPFGKYEIHDATVEDGVVQLKLLNPLKPAEVVSVSVSVKHLENKNDPKTIQAYRVKAVESGLPVNDGKYEPELGTLFEQLNLREIKIRPNTQPPETKTVFDPMLTGSVAQPHGREVILRNSYVKKGLKIQFESPSKLGNVEKRFAEDTGYETTKTNDIGTKKVSSIPVKGVPKKNNLANFAPLPLRKVTRSSNDQSDLPKEPARINELSIFEPPRTGKETRTEPNPMPTIRCTLPDNVKTTLRPYGPSVTLRIEPEHLGPARLSLVMHDDKLRARVVVENHQAKAAVEVSLDKLVEQLSKVNIEVDRVEVMVEGNTARNELFGRHPQWDQFSGQIGRLKMTGTFAFNGKDDMMEPLLGYRPYVGAEGVNLLV